MKEEFAKRMLEKNFRGAAELIFEATLNVHAPQDVNLTINIDRDKNIADLSAQMEKCYKEINGSFSQVSFDGLWSDVFTRPELVEKQNLKSNDLALSRAKAAYEKVMSSLVTKQYEQIFEATTMTLNASLQGVIDAAVKL